jgi:alpha-mannosidase
MRAARLNQPLVAFQTTPHPGTLGRSFSMASLSDSTGQVAVRALKKAEDSDEIVVRVQELYGRDANTRISLNGRVVSARESQRGRRVQSVRSRRRTATLDVTLRPYQPRTFAVRLAPAAAPPPGVSRVVTPLALPFNLDGISLDANRADGDFDGKGLTIAGELWPRELAINGLAFTLGRHAARREKRPGA